MDIIKDALEREDIDYRIKEYRDTAYDGLFILQKGYASLSVPAEHEETARKIISQIRSLPYVVYSKD